MARSQAFDIPVAWKRYLLQAERPCVGQYGKNPSPSPGDTAKKPYLHRKNLDFSL